jgi:hypothetical protein
LILILGVWLGSRLAAAPQPVVVAPLPTSTALVEPLATTPSRPAVAALGCDPVDQLFARMFSGLTDAVIANAGIDRQEMLNATAADRATLKRYLETLGVAADDARLDTLMGGQIPGANLGGPFVSLGSCQNPPSPSSRGR